MWENYSRSYMKHNHASGVSIMAAVFIAAMFLSLLCSEAYNLWAYEIERIVLEEGDWQGRIAGPIGRDETALIENFKNVEKIVVNEGSSENDYVTVDIYFENVRTIYSDMPLIARELGLEKDKVSYHSLLLSGYFIYDPENPEPPVLMAVFGGILLMAAVSLILVIRNSFELSMNARVHQFGIFSSIGATPGQIKVCLLQETAYLNVLPMLAGSLTGIGISVCLIGAVNVFADGVSGRHQAVFQYHPMVFMATVFMSALTVFFSAWTPVKKLGNMTPLEAIRNSGGLQLKKRKHSPILSKLFGIEGELAGNGLKAQKKSLRISAVSLLLSFLGFSMMLVFTTLSSISTRFTYFERYQDAWDVMVTVKDTAIEDFKLTEELEDMDGVRDAAVYQKAEGMSILAKDWQSDELAGIGGFEAVSGNSGDFGEEGMFQVAAPVIVMDDGSFLDYCSQIGAVPGLGGAVVLNRIWDSINSNFRYKEYIPFVKEDGKAARLTQVGQNSQTVEVPVLYYTQTEPVLREEYRAYGLVYVIPLSLWKEIGGQAEETDTYIRIFSDGQADFADLQGLEKAVVQLVGQEYEAESENRIQERIANDRMITGMVAIFGGFCVLLAVIGIANVFSNTLGFLRQRKREFARYMSIGLTPKEMRKIFCIEAFVIAGRPLLITLPLTIMFAQFMVTASYLEPEIFWAEAPVVPIAVFAAAIVGFVALAYYIGGRQILGCDLNGVLKDDALG